MEIIREKLLLDYDKEIPYSTEVIVGSSMKGGRHPYHGSHLCGQDSQKGIIIGKGR